MAKRKINVKILLCYVVIAAFIGYILMSYVLHNPKNAAIIAGKLENSPGFPYDLWIMILFFHIVTGAIALVLGPFQFLKFSRKNKKVHRTIGKMYMSAIFLSVPAGMYLAYYATGGAGSGIGFFVLDIFWFAATFTGLRKILKRDIKSHREWMLRSYAITLVFVTFRIFMPIFVFVMKLGFSIGFPAAIFCSIALNLSLAEWHLRRENKSAKNSIAKTTPV
ncbi:DUF2306 domain-containing protein [Bacillus sp. MUM 13]|uniref:DUF2306 domain-containing protein n=1 Tax=Bacillus sp. MUM 13 TaxID=1678001 RepID=UPI0008F57E8D|nr:DUF2306 domain-containing protein [Bacillus sp. MUM 13]OIK13339.1 hypothetical protein BIV59_06165 [Bacillus sp. MUM 13]